MKFVSQLLSSHLARYPAMELDDVYKLLHQAALGPGHAVDNAAAARKTLDQEIAELGPGFTEPAQDIISPDGRLGRIHLRAYRASGGSIEELHRAFVETANAYPASSEKLEKFCGCLGALAETGAIPFSRTDVIAYFERIAQSGYPAVHHSVAFRKAYQPAYRVVAVELLKN